MLQGLEQSQYWAVNQLASLHPLGQDISCSSEAKLWARAPGYCSLLHNFLLNLLILLWAGCLKAWLGTARKQPLSVLCCRILELVSMDVSIHQEVSLHRGRTGRLLLWEKACAEGEEGLKSPCTLTLAAPATKEAEALAGRQVPRFWLFSPSSNL